MKGNSTIPVYNLQDCKGTDFIIMQRQYEDILRQSEKLHRNSDYFIDWIIQGEVTYSIDFGKYKARTSSLVFLAPEQVRTISNPSKDCRIITIAFNKEFLVLEFQDALSYWQCLFGYNIVHVNTEQVNDLMLYSNLMLSEFNGDQSKKNSIIRNLLNAFMICCARILEKNTPFRCFNLSQNKIVRQFASLAEMHYREKTRVAQYAEMLYISPGHLNDTIKAVVGKSAKQIIDEKRIMEAKRLLFRGDNSVKEIAIQLNFEDDAYFNRFFKKFTGQTPLLFQKNIRDKYN